MTKNTPTPICPKCGYDQSGEIAAWKTQCPLKGTCPECGYELYWPDVANPSRIKLPWFIEHAKSKRQLITRTLPTLWILLIPNRYWRRVTMESPRSTKTYIVWLSVLFLLLHFLTTATLSIADLVFTLNENAFYQSILTTLTPNLQQTYSANIIDTTTTDYWISTIGQSMFYPIIERAIYGNLIVQEIALIATGCLGFSIMWLLLYCAFPTTRKRTQLRLIHIARAAIVAGFLPFLMFQVARFIEALAILGMYWKPLSSLTPDVTTVLGMIGTLLLIIWIQWFWIAATRIGWQVKAKWWELVLVTIASFFGSVIAGLISLAFGPVRIIIEHFANWIGI